ncbi:unnamed protein product [Calicophoron daubneyi]|uniref:Vta1/callose synthase N-terminal domain-containing protein n=1 Tax=Calicophoron daubneyi TaxID=300641 RepID=A0AAV2T4P6_CALDB
MSASAPPPPLKAIGMFVKCAEEHDSRDIVVAYYCRLCAFQKGFEAHCAAPEAKDYLGKLMSKLEEIKFKNGTVEGIASETAGLAHVEEYALKLLNFAYNRDMAGDFSKVTVKSFFTAGVLLDVATTLGTTNEELDKARKYAKWKAIYITQCQKKGEVPVPGPAGASEEVELPDFLGSQQPLQPTGSYPQPSAGASRTQPPAGPKQPGSGADRSPSTAYDEEGTDEPPLDDFSIEMYTAVEKDVKFALSAIQQQDKATTIKFLRNALAKLTTNPH